MPRTPVRYKRKSSTEDKVAVAGGCMFVLVWGAFILADLALLVTIVWAIVKVVNHFL